MVAFLSEFSEFYDTHNLLLLTVDPCNYHSVSDAIAALAKGDAEPEVDDKDESFWHNALASPEQKY
jgi:hypothetical protein